LSLDRYEEAALAFEEAIKVDNLCKEARFNKGYALFLARKFEEALNSYDAALKEYQKYIITIIALFLTFVIRSLSAYERFQTFKKMMDEEDAEIAKEEEGEKYLFIDKDDDGIYDIYSI
jgi:tetratricopeptide (TPR) repeat protein